MESYIHKVNYYETDKMGIVHHSNYVRWLEEARVLAMDEIGYPVSKLEQENLFSTVLSYSIDIKHSTTFEDLVQIIPKVKAYNGVRLEMSYEMKLKDKLVATATTKHCFINETGLPQRLNKVIPGLDKKLKEELEY